jgi:hypothetical protein
MLAPARACAAMQSSASAPTAAGTSAVKALTLRCQVPKRLLDTSTQARAVLADGTDSESDEWDAARGTQAAGAVNAGRGTSGPAQVGLFVGIVAEEDKRPAAAEEHAPRPVSPKYDESVNYLEAFKYYGCEALPDAAATAATPRASAGARAAGTPAAAGAGPVAATTPGALRGGAVRGAAAAAALLARLPRCVDASQITPPSDTHASTPASQAGFTSASAGAPAHVTVMVIEVHAAVRGASRLWLCLVFTDAALSVARLWHQTHCVCVLWFLRIPGELLPDPQHDAVQCVSLCVSDDGTAGSTLTELSLVVDPPDSGNDASSTAAAPPRHCVPGRVTIHSVPDEAALLHALVAAVRAYDPDILLGFDVHAGSLGYLAERCDFLGGVHARLYAALSRTPRHEPPGALRDDEYGRDHGAGIWVTGRAVLNFWRILRGEVKLGSYTYEAAMMAVLRRRVPAVHRRTLREWYASPRSRWRVIADVAGRARGVMLMCTQLDLVGRTSELARVFGIDFNSVLIRGSQYRVESMMLRLAHSQNFLALSPDKKAIGRSEAPEFIALVRPAPCASFVALRILTHECR